MSLRWRWALTFAGIAALALGMAIPTALTLTERQLLAEVDSRLVERVTIIGRNPFDPRSFRGPPFGGRGMPGFEFDALFQLLDAGGEVLYSLDDHLLPVSERDLALAQGGGAVEARTVQVGSGYYRMATTPLPESVGGAIQVAFDISDDRAALAALRQQLSLLGLAAALAAGLVGWLAARRAVGPIERLTAAAEDIAATEQLAADLDVEAPGEIGRLAGAFETMVESLADSRLQQQRLVADAGHELRTPLTALRTNLETLQRSGDRLTDQQRSELLFAALSEVSELTELTSELVDLASDAERSGEQAVVTDLTDLATQVAARYRQRTGRRIDVTGTGAILPVRVSQIERALGNLIDNAHKWSPDGSPIEITLEGSRVAVGDQGPGIPEEDLPHVFERFYRSPEARTKAGSGLGLAIVQHVVEAHGGTVFARNRSDGGAEVGFDLG